MKPACRWPEWGRAGNSRRQCVGEGLNEPDRKRLGSNFSQEIRVAIVEAIEKEH